jgi:hypothetical protein
MFMNYLLAKFYEPSSNGSLVIAMKPKAEEKFRTVTMFLFPILHKYYLNESHVFFEDLLPCQYHMLRGTSVA